MCSSIHTQTAQRHQLIISQQYYSAGEGKPLERKTGTKKGVRKTVGGNRSTKNLEVSTLLEA